MLVNVAAMAVTSTQPTTAAAIVNVQTGLNINSKKQVACLLGMKNQLADKLNCDVIHHALNGLSVAQKAEEKWSANDNMVEYLDRSLDWY